MLDSEKDISTELFRSILDATHQESGSPTQYSTIFDLNSADICVYHFHNFEDGFSFNLHDELAKGEHSYKIMALFETSSQIFKSFEKAHSFEKHIRGPVNSSAYSELVGVYEVMPQIRFTITIKEGKLYGRMRGFLQYALIPKTESTYFFRELKTTFNFVKNENGVVNSLIFSLYGSKMPAKKQLQQSTKR